MPVSELVPALLCAVDGDKVANKDVRGLISFISLLYAVT